MENEHSAMVRQHMPRIIRRYRDAANLSQQQLADYADVSKGFVSALESGRSVPNLEMLIKIAKACSVRPGEMLDAVLDAAEKQSASA